MVDKVCVIDQLQDDQHLNKGLVQEQDYGTIYGILEWLVSFG